MKITEIDTTNQLPKEPPRARAFAGKTKEEAYMVFARDYKWVAECDPQTIWVKSQKLLYVAWDWPRP